MISDKCKIRFPKVFDTSLLKFRRKKNISPNSWITKDVQ